MLTPIMATKLYIPKTRPNAVLRRRLTDKLSKGLYRKLTLISAPAGYGKTTLVCEWLSVCGRQVAWLSLDEGDKEITRFLSCLITSLQTLEETIGEGVLAVLQAPQPPPIEWVLTALLNEIATIPYSFLLVLDDYHTVNSEPINHAIFYLLQHLPAQMNMIITTRENPDIPISRLRVRDHLTELGSADLRFTLSESESYMNGVMELNLSPDTIISLESSIEGWIAGLHLAALSIQGDLDAHQMIQSFTGGHRYVLDYLVEEVLQQQTEAVQNFLLHTSILDRFCGSLCDEVMQDPSVSGQEILKELHRKNMFVVPLDNEGQWYRYHHLFAESLRQRLHASWSESCITELHHRASVWYEHNGFDIEAFRHAVESADTERSALLLEGRGMPLHLRGAADIVLNWLESLPEDRLDAKPALWVIYGSALLIAGRPTGVEHKLKAAETALADASQDEDIRDLMGLIAATRATLASLVLNGHPDETDHVRKLRAAETAMQTTTVYDKTDELVGMIASSGVAGVNEIHRNDQVIIESQRALAYLRRDNLPVRTAAAWMLGAACQRSEDYPAAREAYNEVISNSRIMNHQLMAIMALIGLGQIGEIEDRSTLAAEYYQEALQLGGDLPLPALREAQLGLERIASREKMTGTLIEPLSQREIEVLELIAKGLSNREIADKLFLALDTVKGHNRRIFEKLQVQRRTEAIARANELSLFKSTRKPH